MANTKISALTSATTPLAGTEVLPIVQSSTTVKVAVSDLTAGRSISVSGLTNTGLTASKPVFTDASKVLTSTGVVPVANGGTNASAASITAFNNITGYAAAGATGTTSTNLVFSTSPSITTPTLVGDANLSTGNITQGTAAKGINFTANTPLAGMTSQLLNWYEEGTFLPTIYGSSVAGVGTYSIQTGTYVKVGKIVTFTAVIEWSAHTGSGNMFANNLPFTCANNTACAWRGDSITLTAGYYLTLSINAGTKNIVFVQTPTGPVSGNNVPLDTAGFIIISGSYIST